MPHVLIFNQPIKEKSRTGIIKPCMTKIETRTGNWLKIFKGIDCQVDPSTRIPKNFTENDEFKKKSFVWNRNK